MRNKARVLLLKLLCVPLMFVAVSSYAADASKGGELYTVHCASCHGVSGASDMPNVPSFNQTEALLQPDITLLDTIRIGRRAMPAYQGILSDSDIMDLIAYLRTLN